LFSDEVRVAIDLINAAVNTWFTSWATLAFNVSKSKTSWARGDITLNSIAFDFTHSAETRLATIVDCPNLARSVNESIVCASTLRWMNTFSAVAN
jgi:hypothetical protein